MCTFVHSKQYYDTNKNKITMKRSKILTYEYGKVSTWSFNSELFSMCSNPQPRPIQINPSDTTLSIPRP